MKIANNSQDRQASQSNQGTIKDGLEQATRSTRDWRYGAIITALCVTSSLVALEGTVVSTALPSISHDLGGGASYLWVVNAYFLSSTAFLPLYGQSANIFGRRWLMVSAIAFFILGSGISGGASSMAMLIAGRTIQGIGGGGCSMLIDLIISDLVPVRERGSVMGYIFGAATVCTALGPFIGGAFVEHVTWRWVFYINIPIASLALVLVLLFLHMQYEDDVSLKIMLKRVDFEGNIIFVAATIAILFALTNAGTLYSWNSWRILLPLCLGFAGLLLFFAYEQTAFCTLPTLPARLFGNRTSAAALVLTFLHMMLLYWEIYFLPLYFQAVRRSSPTRAGVELLPTVINFMVFAGVGGALLQKIGRYREIHAAGFGLMALGLGLMLLLNENSSTAEWVIFQLIFAAGGGLPIGTLLPVAQGALHERDTAVVTGVWAVLRSFGTIWGVTIAAAAFNNHFNNLIKGLADAGSQLGLSNGNGYEHGTRAFIESLGSQPVLQREIVHAYDVSIRLTWKIATGLASLGFLIVFAQRHITLRTELETDFGMVEKPSRNDESLN